jgi:hypothetical protein
MNEKNRSCGCTSQKQDSWPHINRYVPNAIPRVGRDERIILNAIPTPNAPQGGRDERIKRNLSTKSKRSWCLNCRLHHEVSAGKMSQNEVDELLSSMPRGQELFSGGNRYDVRSCSNSDETLIDNAILYIRRHHSDIPASADCVVNTTNHCLAGGNGQCLGGHSSQGPRATVVDALNTLRIHCYGGLNCSANPWAYTWCSQWNDQVQDIYICQDILSWITARSLACVIVHEIYHAWGADENAATAMAQGWLPWRCP